MKNGGPGRRAQEPLNNSTLSFQRTPEPRQIKHPDPSVHRDDELFRLSQSREGAL
jgi:hypothetical protein